MARHNREGHGTDQRGYRYTIGYQPDWLKTIKVTRSLQSGRQSSKTLFRNPDHRAKERPGSRVRTRIVSKEQDLDFEIIIDDRKHRVTRVRVTCRLTPHQKRALSKAGIHVGLSDDGDDEVEFTIEDNLPPP